MYTTGLYGYGVAVWDAVTFLLGALTVAATVRTVLGDMAKERTGGRECLTSSLRQSFRREERYVDCMPCRLLYKENIGMHVCISRM